jgi:uncharacterized protein YfaS (alpha-2-macroglobulin family)
MAQLPEPAFFLPHVVTDKDGAGHFDVKAPAALGRWRVRLLAVTVISPRVRSWSRSLGYPLIRR